MTARTTRTALVLLTVALGFGLVDGGGAAPDASFEELTRQRRTLRLKLRRERAALLRNDPDISRINDEIRKLYRELDAALAAKPIVRELKQELTAVEKALQQQRQGRF